MRRRRIAKLAATALIAAIGGALGVRRRPAGRRGSAGAMIATTTASLAGFDTRLPLRLVDAVFLVIGITLGAGVSPEVVAGVAAWPISLAGLLLSVARLHLGVRAFLVHVAGWDRDTAFFSAVPGALSYVLAVASLTHADMRKVAVSQSIRIFLLVALLPSVITALEPVKAAAVGGNRRRASARSRSSSPSGSPPPSCSARSRRPRRCSSAASPRAPSSTAPVGSPARCRRRWSSPPSFSSARWSEAASPAPACASFRPCCSPRSAPSSSPQSIAGAIGSWPWHG